MNTASKGVNVKYMKCSILDKPIKQIPDPSRNPQACEMVHISINGVTDTSITRVKGPSMHLSLFFLPELVTRLCRGKFPHLSLYFAINNIKGS